MEKRCQYCGQKLETEEDDSCNDTFCQLYVEYGNECE